MGILGNFFFLRWVFLILIGLVLGAWYWWSRSREEADEAVEGVKAGPVQMAVTEVRRAKALAFGME